MCQKHPKCVVFVYMDELLFEETYRKSCCFRSSQSKNNTIRKEHHVTGPKFCGKYLDNISTSLRSADTQSSL